MDPLAAARAVDAREAAEGIPRVLADLAASRSAGRSLHLTDHDVRTALAPSAGRAPSTPFAWSARTARRGLGLAALRFLVAGEARTPTEGTQSAIAGAIRSVREGNRPTSTMDRWLAGLPGAGLAVVQAEAVTWATHLWSALDWSAFARAPVIGRDHWWNSPHSPLLGIRSRAEVRSVSIDAGEVPFSVHLVVLGGSRRPTVRAELSVVAMVEALHAPRSLPPGRIVGWWPDSGHIVTVEVDRATLDVGVESVARTLATVEATPVAFEGVARAAA
ncbi:MAG: hypothetical protein ACLQRH_16910 [Acidimicrobiales bacterium]